MRAGWVGLASVCLAMGVGDAALAAGPAIIASDTSIRLGLIGGYTQVSPNDGAPRGAAGGDLGGEIGISALTDAPFGDAGLPDFYSAATYDFTSGFFSGRPDGDSGGESRSEGAIVRLGFGLPEAAGAETIPYIAGGYQAWYGNGAAGGGSDYYQAGVIGGGLKLDLAAGSLFVLSASAEGLAMFGGTVSAPSRNFNSDPGDGTEERVSLDADYRLDEAWHAFAGIGVSHYNYNGAHGAATGAYDSSSSTLQFNSVFGLAYGF
jgi:hypothetical protein